MFRTIILSILAVISVAAPTIAMEDFCSYGLSNEEIMSMLTISRRVKETTTPYITRQRLAGILVVGAIGLALFNIAERTNNFSDINFWQYNPVAVQIARVVPRNLPIEAAEAQAPVPVIGGEEDGNDSDDSGPEDDGGGNQAYDAVQRRSWFVRTFPFIGTSRLLRR